MKKLTILLTLIIFALSVQILFAQSAKLSFQGVLRDIDGRSFSDGNYQLTFRFYDAETNGNQIGSDIVKTVNVENGVYSTVLDATDLSGLGFDQDYYVGTVYDNAAFPNRVALTSSPYALSLMGTDNVFPSSGAVGVGTANPASGVGFQVNGISYFNGNVGLNITNPARRLHVHDSASNTSYAKFSNSTTGIGSSDGVDIGIGSAEEAIIWQRENNHMRFGTNNAERMRIENNGNVGIGTDDPGTMLHIYKAENPILRIQDGRDGGSGTHPDEGQYGTIQFYSSDGNRVTAQIKAVQMGGGTVPDVGLTFHTNDDNNGSFERMRITNFGRVGIGTTDPQAKLHVSGNGNTIQTFSGSSNGGAWMSYQSGAGEDEIGWANAADPLTDVSIYASGSIVADGVGVFVASTVNWSDERTKTILGKTDNRTDLELLKQIEITDYVKIKDKVREKKVIAQQVREIYPQAVSFMRGAIPNVFEMTDNFSYDAQTSRLTVTTDKQHEFIAGDEVNIYTDVKDLERIKVASIPSENTFIVDVDHNPEQVFVYGKWVDDVHTVDYDAISMLNVSATQELANQNKRQDARIAQLEHENTELKNRLAELEQFKAEFAQFKAMMKQQSTVKQTNLH
ncbi:MAG: hypothetical protein GY869_18255 [Planctomycetes bacterium]|nr:hypothetical protein [Planctomycetota bacterium]